MVLLFPHTLWEKEHHLFVSSSSYLMRSFSYISNEMPIDVFYA